MREPAGKRPLDLVGGLVALVLSAPVLVVAALLVKLEDRGPVIYRQTRVGRGGSDFELLKLRTMVVGAEKLGAGYAVDRGDPRITRIGRVLRRLSIDELPQFWNVLRGDMSLVGPRPLPVAYLPRYTAEEARRHDVRPGLTGWAQVNGRNTVDWDERLALDVWYVGHRSLPLDLRILWRTVSVVVKREGISGVGTETMQELRPR